MKTIEQPVLVPAVEESTALATTGSVGMFERLAADPNVPVDKLERLIAMQERISAHNARSAFNSAFSEMQGEIPAVIERAKTDKGTYAPLEDIVETIRPILQRHGFSLSFKTEWPDKTTVRVIGILTHRDGHERTSEFLSGADNSGSKNAIQGLGSAVTYGRRYTAKDLLNITTRGADDDGRATAHASKPDVRAPAGFEEWLTDIEAVAQEGMAKLTDAWNKSKPEHRNHLIATNRGKWDGLKAKAAKVKS